MEEFDLQAIRQDISDFADPATPVVVSAAGASWFQDRKAREVRFVSRPGLALPDLNDGSRQTPYLEFFSSDTMADLRGLADSILVSLSDVQAYLPPRARRELLSGGEESADAAQVIQALCAPSQNRTRTQVTFLRGPAGAGKTAFLKHLTIHSARQFSQGASPFVYLYIDAQGRALARLDEAMALILQDLRARFTYHAVAALTRMGLLVPIVDGFDELLGAGGYDEAFSSLARFLAKLQGRGSLVASARATFYQYSNFPTVTRRLGEAAQGAVNFEITPVDVLPWEQGDARKYVGLRTSNESISKQVADIVQSRSDLLSTPFFIAQLVDFLTGGDESPQPDQVTSFLVRRIVRREVDKLRGANGEPLLSEDQHLRFLALIAEEMWWLGTRELDLATIRTVAELACDEFGLGSSAAQIVTERASSHAALAVATQPNLLRFQHEYYLAFFLSGLLVNSTDLTRVLGRSMLGPVVAEEVASVLDDASSTAFLDKLNGIRLTVTARDALRGNIGSLVASLIRRRSHVFTNRLVLNAVFEEPDFRNTRVDNATFRECYLVGPDFSGASWKAVRFEETSILRMAVDPRTKFDEMNLRVPEEVVGLIRRSSSGTAEELFYPSEVSVALQAIGVTLHEEHAAQRSANAERRAKVVRKFARMARKVFRFSNDDLDNCGLRGDMDWEWVQSALLDAGLLTRLARSRRGPTGEMLQLTVRPDALLGGEGGASADALVSQFWRNLDAS